MKTLQQIYETRRANLGFLIKAKFSSRQTLFISETGITQGLVSGWMTGKRSFGERAARKVEEKLDLPFCWFDQEQTQSVEQGGAQ